jgi:hypothetical protein
MSSGDEEIPYRSKAAENNVNEEVDDDEGEGEEDDEVYVPDSKFTSSLHTKFTPASSSRRFWATKSKKLGPSCITLLGMEF